MKVSACRPAPAPPWASSPAINNTTKLSPLAALAPTVRDKLSDRPGLWRLCERHDHVSCSKRKRRYLPGRAIHADGGCHFQQWEPGKPVETGRTSLYFRPASTGRSEMHRFGVPPSGGTDGMGTANRLKAELRTKFSAAVPPGFSRGRSRRVEAGPALA